MFSSKTCLLVVTIIAEVLSESDPTACDKHGVLFYEDMGCESVKIEGQCPLKYQCDFNRPKNGCIFKGKNYSPGEDITSDVTYSACQIGCRCEDFDFIRCAVLDCPEAFGGSPGERCYSEYEIGKCCSIGQICPNGTTEEKKCLVDGVNYDRGAKFYPKNTCLTCVCHENFTEGNYDEETCMRQNCAAQIYFTEEINKKCAPAYFNFRSEEVLCCPDDFVCPDPDLDSIRLVNREADPKSELQCQYGTQVLKLGEGFNRKVNKYGKDRQLLCQCSMPPLVTCVEF
ncbi:uncharacterized protein [Euwallacea similis]|uniref:uncharacterized protein n=1 Tax=Euwallacea similis TaxID=1736056 RepID=UPI00344D4F8B